MVLSDGKQLATSVIILVMEMCCDKTGICSFLDWRRDFLYIIPLSRCRHSWVGGERHLMFLC